MTGAVLKRTLEFRKVHREIQGEDAGSLLSHFWTSEC